MKQSTNIQKEKNLKLVRQIVTSIKFFNSPLAEQQNILQQILLNPQNQINDDDLDEILSYRNRNLRIVSLNVGFRVMSNEVKGTEYLFVKYCQDTYNGGWLDDMRLSRCSSNSADFLTDHNLFGLQEVNHEFQPEFENYIKELGARKGKDFHFFSSYYFVNYAVVVGYDRNVMGEGIQITPDNYVFGGRHENEMRGMQAVYFPLRNLLFINLHAPHDIGLLHDLNSNFEYIADLVIARNIDPSSLRIIVVGDFNDYKGQLIESSRNGTLTIFGESLSMHDKAPKSCCADTKYKFVGDYIFDSALQKEDKLYYYGLPINYDRSISLYSDHDPVILLELDNLEEKIFEGIVSQNGTYIEIEFRQLDQDMLFDIARIYLKNQGKKRINWNMVKPLAWTHYGSFPHVTLHRSMEKYLGEKVQVRFGTLYNWANEYNRWVVISAQIPEKYKCEYECHMSLAQQSLK